jgi:hypothetical protein
LFNSRYNLAEMLNLSFLPGDLHLSKDAQGFFVLTLEDREILKTKSQRAASAKYLSLRREIEKLFPSAETTPADKRALLEREVTDSRVEHWLPKQSRRISPSALFEIEVALGAYYTALKGSDLTPSSQETYMNQAENFVQWLKGEFEPGCRVAPYRAKKPDAPK